MANAINSLKLGSGTYVFTTPYATCGTAAATAAKVAATTPGSNFSLETGARVTVKFTVTNTAANPTLNVNSTGAKAIYYRGSAISAGYLAANRTYEFVYHGTQYDFIGDIDTNTNTDTTTTTGATDTSSKIFLIGATSQSTAPTTYSHDTVYVGTDGCLYSNSKKVATLGDNNTFTGTNMFKGGAAQFRTSSAGLNDPQTDVSEHGVKCTTGGSVGTYYQEGKIENGTSTLTLPSISGTIALKSDISSIGTFDDSIDIWDTTYSGDKYVSIEAAGSGSICVHNDDEGTLLTLNLPAINDGTYTIATTSDIPSASNFVTVANAQTIYGKKTFNGGVQFGTDTVFNNGGIQIPAANAFKVMGMYDVSLPSKSGTIALTSDIPSGGGSGDVTAAGNNIFTGNNSFQGGTTSFTTASPRPGASVTTVDADGVRCQTDGDTGTYYQDNQIQHQGFSLGLPYKSGTLATTSDFPIKSATLSGTTLSITLS